MVGEVWLVGAGPGDPGLLTLKGKELLSRADVVVYDRLVHPDLLRWAGSAERIDVGKRPDGRGGKQEEINSLLVELARAGKKVVRLKGGDPFIFGRGGEEALALARAGVPFRVVPGVTAASGCGAYAGVPLTHRGLASTLGVATGHEDPGKDSGSVDYRALAGATDTVVVYMGMARLEEIVGELLAGGREAGEPAALVQDGTRSRQRVLTAPLGDLPKRAAAAGMAPPALLIVGRVVGLREQLDWYGRLPLRGCRVAITRPVMLWEPGRAEEPMVWPSSVWEMAGAELRVYRVLRLLPPTDGALRESVRTMLAGEARRPAFHWVLLTSAAGVEALRRTIWSEGGDCRCLAGCRMGVVGPGTAQALERLGIRPELVASPSTVDTLVEMVARMVRPGERVLLARSDLAQPVGERLRLAGAGEVREVVAYRTVPDEEECRLLTEDVRAGEIDVLVLTSASAARAVATAAQAAAAQTVASRAVATAGYFPFPPVVAIGPMTEKAALASGLQMAAVATSHDRSGVLAAVEKLWNAADGKGAGREVAGREVAQDAGGRVS